MMAQGYEMSDGTGYRENVIKRTSVVEQEIPFEGEYNNRCSLKQFVCECMSICVYVCLYCMYMYVYLSVGTFRIRVRVCECLRVCLCVFPRQEKVQ